MKTDPSRFAGTIDRRARDELTRKTLARVGVEVAPERLVADLSAAQRAEVAIARTIRDLQPGASLGATGAGLRRSEQLDVEA
ncbi:hypothetical protein [Streptomyces sp. NPDC095613]|uniref:hypothetical protein n=1 Tax=Streptomyces sp. NPDC095613 TaxID=3155540 RepID=UPI003327E3BD